MAQKEFSEKKMENVINQTAEWIADFLNSDNYQTMDKKHQEKAVTIIESFSKMMYQKELRVIREWTGSSLEIVLTKYFPTMENYGNLEPSILIVLKNYFSFLQITNKIKNAETLKRKLEKIELPSSDVEETRGKDRKVHYTNEDLRRFNRFPMGRIERSTTEIKEKNTDKGKKVGRNEPCPCGSGKKYKKCHGK